MVPKHAVDSDLGKELPIGSHHYRAFVGPPEKYDLVSAMQFNLLTALGLREHHFLLDIGCGSLRAGRLFIPYLLRGRYFGIEPEGWLIEEGIRKEVGSDLINIKKPVFSSDRNFTLTVFNRHFDFLVAHSVFSHASAIQIRRCLSEARKVMTSTSILSATFVRGAESYKGDEWIYPDCVSYTMDFINGVVEQQGLTCIPIDWPHPNNQTWVVITDPSNRENVPHLDDAARLEYQLRVCSERLAKIDQHPYVKLGLKIRRLLTRWS